MKRPCLSRLLMWPALAALALAVSCAGERTCDPGCRDGRPIPSTPEDVVALLAWSCEQRDIEAYEACLGDDYTFWFAEPDWDSAGVTAEEPFWPRAYDLGAMENLFGSLTVRDVHFDYTVTDTKAYDDSALVTIRPSLGVTIEMADDEPVTLLVTHSVLEIKATRAGGNRWTIRRMAEFVIMKRQAHPDGVSAVEPSTFGTIKWKFR